MNTIAVVGAGMMGPGIAQVFAASGHPVCLCNRSAGNLDGARERVRENLVRMAEYNLVDDSQIPCILERIRTTTDLADACRDADFVIETITENLAMKRALFAEVDRICPPETILASNTSVISITEIGSQSVHRERILGTHFYQPPFLVPLVEVVRTELTGNQQFEAVFELLESIGKVPVRVNKDVPGFIANRMQHALWREAFSLIDEGICDAATVDIAVQNSFGMRLPVLGPVANADLVGLDLTLAIHDYVLQHLNASPEPSSTLRAHVDEGNLGFKSKHGFLTWTEDSMADLRNRVSTHLLESLASQKKKKRAIAGDNSKDNKQA